MHLLDLTGYGMTHARIEPHQIPFGPVHVAMLLLCSTRCCRRGLRQLALSSHLVPLIRVRFPLLLVPLVSSRSHIDCRQQKEEEGKVSGEEGASRSFKRLQAGWCIAVNTNRRNNTWLGQLNINLPHFTATARKHKSKKLEKKKQTSHHYFNCEYVPLPLPYLMQSK